MTKGDTVDQFIAYGGGLGSTALIVDNLAAVRAGDLEVVYVDHQADLPETTQYLEKIQEGIDIDITILKPGSLYDYCYQHDLLPSLHWRWCTDKFKIRPMKKYAGEDIPQIGLTYDERWRVRDFAFEGKSVFPLVKKEMSRYKAVQKMEQEDCPMPCKSGCFFCPFQSKEQWRQLYRNHNDLFLKAVRLEENAMERNPNIYLYEGNLRAPVTLQRLKVEFDEQTELLVEE